MSVSGGGSSHLISGNIHMLIDSIYNKNTTSKGQVDIFPVEYIKFGNIEIGQSELNILSSKSSDLNDSCVDFFLSLLHQLYIVKSNRRSSPIYIASSLLFTKLCPQSHPNIVEIVNNQTTTTTADSNKFLSIIEDIVIKNYKEGKIHNWFKKKNINLFSNFDYIIFPICFANHWILVLVIMKSNASRHRCYQSYIFDSLKSSDVLLHNIVSKVIHTFLNLEFNQIITENISMYSSDNIQSSQISIPDNLSDSSSIASTLFIPPTKKEVVISNKKNTILFSINPKHILVSHCSFQENLTDCGLFLIEYARFIINHIVKKNNAISDCQIFNQTFFKFNQWQIYRRRKCLLKVLLILGNYSRDKRTKILKLEDLPINIFKEVYVQITATVTNSSSVTRHGKKTSTESINKPKETTLPIDNKRSDVLTFFDSKKKRDQSKTTCAVKSTTTTSSLEDNGDDFIKVKSKKIRHSNTTLPTTKQNTNSLNRLLHRYTGNFNP